MCVSMSPLKEGFILANISIGPGFPEQQRAGIGWSVAAAAFPTNSATGTRPRGWHLKEEGSGGLEWASPW